MTPGKALAWLGGGQASPGSSSQDRSAYQVAGLVVVLGGLLAWVIATVAIAAATSLPVVAIAPFTVVFGLFAGALSRAIASSRHPSRRGLVGRGAIALFVGLVIGELAATVLFSGAIDRSLDRQAADQAAASPAVVQAGQRLDQARGDRARLDDSVRDARTHVDDALVTARCEYNPNPNCPPQKITGDPGTGPEARNANDMLAGAQRELDLTTATRDSQAPGLDAEIRQNETALASAQAAAPTDVDRGLGARWTAMHDYTTGNAGAMLLRLLTIAFFALLSLLPLLLKLWRGETHQDRHDAAQTVRDRAEQESETAIAVKRAQVRAEAENLWAEQQLAKARLAAEAQTEIDREEQRRRVIAAQGGLPTATSHRLPIAESVARELNAAPKKKAAPIAAEAPTNEVEVSETKNLPATLEQADAPARRSGPLGILPAGLHVPNSIPDLTNQVTGLVKPFVPSVVSKTIGSVSPFRSARTLIEEFDEVHFSFTRRRKVSYDEQQSGPSATTDDQQVVGESPQPSLRKITTTRLGSEPREYAEIDTSWSTGSLPAADDDLTPRISGRHHREELAPRPGPRELPPGQ
ncbi:DUF4407 domain-containing protein [Antrihabitans cavernicola]|nr:DUF4407 domain-containing protein [Spelaeibacter cavernicola]